MQSPRVQTSAHYTYVFLKDPTALGLTFKGYDDYFVG